MRLFEQALEDLDVLKIELMYEPPDEDPEGPPCWWASIDGSEDYFPGETVEEAIWAACEYSISGEE